MMQQCFDRRCADGYTRGQFLMVVQDALIDNGLIGVAPVVLPMVNGDGSNQGSNNIPASNVVYEKNMIVVHNAPIGVASAVLHMINSGGSNLRSNNVPALNVAHGENMMVV